MSFALLKKIVKVLCEVIAYPVVHYPVAFLLMVIALYAPDMQSCDSFLKVVLMICTAWFGRMFVSFSIAYILTVVAVLLGKIHRVVGTVFAIMFTTAILAVSFVDFYLYFGFGMKISAAAFQLVTETDKNETLGFLSAYIFTGRTLMVALLIAAIVGSLIFLNRRFSLSENITAFLSRHIIAQAVISVYTVVAITFFCMSIPYHFTDSWPNNLMDSPYTSFVRNTFPFRISNAYLQYEYYKDSFNKCAESQLQVGEIESVGNKIRNIVLVIGESYSRHHSQLYGYYKETNPYLVKDSSELHVFKDVITAANFTSVSFTNFLSLTSFDEKCEWCDKPFFLSVFKKAGFNVVMYSNQLVNDGKGDPWDAACGFLNHPVVERCAFTRRNKVKYDYDEELVSEFAKIMPEYDTCQMNLYIIHLMGQHFPAENRFPSGWDFFKAEDYADRTELSDEEKQQVANYDNATRYNDYVLSKILSMFSEKDAIVICFADHGEEVNDYRPNVGREHRLAEFGAPCIHCQFDIPFFIYMTDSFKISHPQLVEKVAGAVDRPFMTDDLPHLLLDIADIRNKWFNPSRSVINDSFDASRRRKLSGFESDQENDYDVICGQYGPWKIGYGK